MTVQLRPFAAIPGNLREWAKWMREQNISAETNSVTTAMLQDESVTLAKMADLAGDTIVGRLSTTGVPQALTVAQTVTLLEAAGWNFSAAVGLDGTVGFFGTTPVGQQTTPSTLSMTTISGTGDDADINTNFSAIQAAVNAIKTALDNLGATA